MCEMVWKVDTLIERRLLFLIALWMSIGVCVIVISWRDPNLIKNMFRSVFLAVTIAVVMTVATIVSSMKWKVKIG